MHASSTDRYSMLVETQKVETQKEAARSWVARLPKTHALTLLAFLLGAAVVLAHRPFSHAESGDKAIYDYIAQSILRGQLPYRDVIDPKAPASMYLSAAAMAAGKSIGIRDVIAVRWLHVLLMGLLAAITFLVAEEYLRNRLAATVAFLIPLMIDSFSLMVIGGTQPKLPMILFGMLSLLMIAWDRPLWAGVTSMLSCLCWQPGLMFTGVAFLIFSRYLTSWRDLRAVKVVLGAIVPLAVVLLYFYSKGALGDLWSWTITYTYGVFAPESARTLGQSLAKFWIIVRRELRSDVMVAAIGLAGLLIYVAARARAKIKGKEGLGPEDLFRDAIAYPPLIYLIFCMINFQGGPDLIPFFPFIGLFAAWLFVEADRLIAAARPKLKGLVPLGATLVIVTSIIIRGVSYKPAERTLEAQDREVQVIANHLGPGDKMYVHGAAEILVLLNRPNLNPYIALDTGADNYIAAHKPGGFQDVINEIEAEAPKVVAITRLRNVRHRKELREWVEQHYQRLALKKFKGVYIRRR